MRYTINEFQKEFPTNDACLEYIFRKKYDPEGWYRIKGRKSYANAYGKQIHPLKGTIFENSRTPLTSWFYAIYLFSQSKHGMSAAELQRHLGVTYKCAWRIAHRIRSLMKQPSRKLKGVIEADETFIGGMRRLNSWRHAKIPVMGIIERNGFVRAIITENHTEYSIVPFIEKNVRKGSLLFTDGAPVYRIVQGVKHDHVLHYKKEYVRGMIHTCTIDGFWSTIKRNIRTTYRLVSKQHLQKYVDEAAFYWNHRKKSPFQALVKAL